MVAIRGQVVRLSDLRHAMMACLLLRGARRTAARPWRINRWWVLPGRLELSSVYDCVMRECWCLECDCELGCCIIPLISIAVTTLTLPSTSKICNSCAFGNSGIQLPCHLLCNILCLGNYAATHVVVADSAGCREQSRPLVLGSARPITAIRRLRVGAPAYAWQPSCSRIMEPLA